MKRGIVTLIFLLSVTWLSAQVQMVRLTRFEGCNLKGIIVDRPFEVEVYQSDQTRAEVEIPVSLEKYLVFDLKNDSVLHLGFEGKIREAWEPYLKARIYVKELSLLRGSGAAQIACVTPIQTSTLQLDLLGAVRLQTAAVTVSEHLSIVCSGASHLRGDLETKTLSVVLKGASGVNLDVKAEQSTWELSAASHATLQGVLQSASLTAQSASSIEADQCTFGNVKASASAASTIQLGETDQLSAKAVGASHIYYDGEPQVDGWQAYGFSWIVRR